MNLQDKLNAIFKRIASDKKLSELFNAYLLSVKQIEHDENLITDTDYTEGKAALEQMLSDEQKTVLADIEKSWRKNIKLMMIFGFFSGLCVNLKKTSVVDEERLFDELIVNAVLTKPGIINYPDYYNERQHTLKLSASLECQLDEDGKEHLVSIECAWDEKLYNILRHAFHLGLLIADTTYPYKKTDN